MSVVDNAVYSGGRRVAAPESLDQTIRVLQEHRQQGAAAPADSVSLSSLAWIGLVDPTDAELSVLTTEFNLHQLAVEDAVHAHQRAKLERYGSTLFVVLRPARYLDAAERVEFSEVHLFVGRDFVVTVRHGDSPNLARVRRRMEANPDLLARGPEAVLYAILDEVVDGYSPVITGLQNDIDEIESEVFQADPGVSKRIYSLSRQIIEFQRATTPLTDILNSLIAGFAKYGIDPELQQYLRDVADHVTRVVEHAEAFRQLLQNILTVNAALVGQRQNEEMKTLTETSLRQNEGVRRISAWAAILFAPTLVGTIYGMNFDHMPELHWTLGYPLAVLSMLAVSVILYVVFRARKWI